MLGDMNMWKKIIVDGIETFYSVSIEGKVRNDRRNSLLNQHEQQGYMHVSLSCFEKTKRLKVHRLVAIAFIPNPENKPYVNHKNGNKSDNTVENLEWVTASENTIHAWDTGLAKSTVARNVVQYSLSGEKIAEYKSVREASLSTESSEEKISMCCNNKRKSHNGYQWKFQNENLSFLPDYTPVTISKRVAQYRGDKLIRVYDSIREAANSVNGTPSAISRVLSGTAQTKTHKGFSWKYVG
jgi:WD40 repeat protein